MLRTITFILIGLGAAVWLWLVTAILLASGEGGFGMGLIVIGVTGATFLVFALPALVLALKRKFPGLALVLAALSLVSAILVA